MAGAMITGMTNRGVTAEAVRGAKQAAFEQYDAGLRPSQVDVPDVKKATLYRYFQEWKRLRRVPSAPGIADAQPVQEGAPTVGGGVPPASAIRARFAEFQARQQLEAEKRNLQERIEGWFGALEEAEEKRQKSGVEVEGWEERVDRLGGQIDFALTQLGGIESEQDLGELQAVMDEVEASLDAVLGEYQSKLEEQERLRQEQEMEVSRRLIAETLNVEYVPPFVVQALQTQVLVRDRDEAGMVFRAVTEWEVVNDACRAEPGRRRKLWHSFLDGVGQEGWEFIRKLARSSEDRDRQIYGERLWCPWCWAQHVIPSVSAVYRCRRCGRPIYSFGLGPIAYPGGAAPT